MLESAVNAVATCAAVAPNGRDGVVWPSNVNEIVPLKSSAPAAMVMVCCSRTAAVFTKYHSYLAPVPAVDATKRVAAPVL